MSDASSSKHERRPWVYPAVMFGIGSLVELAVTGGEVAGVLPVALVCGGGYLMAMLSGK